MKHLICTLIIGINFSSCNAQKITKMEQNIIIPKITKDSEKIEAKTFREKGSMYEIKKDNEYKVYSSAIIGFGEVTYYNNSYFKVLRSFYPSNHSKKKGIAFNNGSEYGIWYHFDESGKLVKEEDTDKGYDFGWKNIIAYCEKNEIRLEKGYPQRGGIKTEIYKNEEEGNKVWTISYYDYTKEKYLEVTLDGKTGKQLKQRELEFIGN